MADTQHSSSDETCNISPEKKSGESKNEFSVDEEDLIIRMFNLVGERWSLIAGRIPGRSEEEIKKYWNSRCQLVNRLNDKQSILGNHHFTKEKNKGD